MIAQCQQGQAKGQGIELYLWICPVHYDVAAPHLYSASSQPPVISSFNQLVTNIVSFNQLVTNMYTVQCTLYSSLDLTS